MRLSTFMILLAVLLALGGCSRNPIPIPPLPLPDLITIETPKTAAEQSVVDAKKAVVAARADGDTLAILEAEQKYARASAKLALAQAATWKQADADKTEEIKQERDARRQAFLYWFSGIVGLLAILATAGALAWPTTRSILRPVAVFLGALVPVLLFAAWLIPYLPWIALGTGVCILGVGGYYLSTNERTHRLKDRATEQVIEAVGAAKERIPEFRTGYKDIFRATIDTDVDHHLNRLRLGLQKTEDATVAARLAH